ncbi:hypothetical protein [Mesorhizobium sp.]|uniref:hypothetical protein n=1 Tax=Mesorhizobium sp. TaxID=1871066 RepID=UPI00257D0A75|nr:hypothetical protein [Mesorhizobium sp.]
MAEESHASAGPAFKVLPAHASPRAEKGASRGLANRGGKRSCGADVVKNLYDTYAKRDIEGALVDCADDIVFRWVAEPAQSRYAGWPR